MDNTDKLDDFIRECRDLGLEILPPDINDSNLKFQAQDENRIRYGLGAIKGFGRAAIDAIILDREANGPYPDLAKFCNRLDLQKTNRRSMDVSLRSGALDDLDPDRNRARLMHELPDAVLAAEQLQHDRKAGQSDMFGIAEHTEETRSIDHLACEPWTELQSLQGERAALGLYLTGHPTQIHQHDLRRITSCQLSDVGKRIPPDMKNKHRAGVQMTLAGLVHSIRRMGNRGSFVSIEDQTGRLEVALFDEVWALYAEILIKDEIVVIEGKVNADKFSGGYRMSAQKIRTLADAKSEYARGIQISIRGTDEDLSSSLQSAFLPYRNGPAPVTIDYSNNRARARLELGEEWNVKPCEELVAALSELDAVTDARLLY
jgi:DNA polymerase-3 subunit alpha